MSVSSAVWERSGRDTMTRSAFYFVLGAILAWGFAATAMAAKVTASWHMNILEILLLGLGLPILGIVISLKSENPALSFLGYHLVVVPFGMILGPTLAMYELAKPGVVYDAACLTGVVTAVMAASGTMFPDFYKSIGGALFGALSCLVVVSILSLFIPALAGFTPIHYIAAGIFALYIGFDMWRASELPATLDNAIDVAVALYLDVINLFLHTLQIYANSSSDD